MDDPTKAKVNGNGNSKVDGNGKTNGAALPAEAKKDIADQQAGAEKAAAKAKAGKKGDKGKKGNVQYFQLRVHDPLKTDEVRTAAISTLEKADPSA